MVKVKIVFGLFWIFSVCISDELIDDFEHEISLNYRNLGWYYFSDVKDGGNSLILNVEKLPNGSYSEFRRLKEGIIGSYCAKLVYTLGDLPPFSYMDHKENYSNFVAIGTDLSQPGRYVDISNAYGVKFRVRSRDSILVYFELATEDIHDYAYYREYFWVDKNWKTVNIHFRDSTRFCQPANDRVDLKPLDLSKTQKMNWVVASSFYDIELPDEFDGWRTNRKPQSDTGYLYIDDISLLSNEPVGISFHIKNHDVSQKIIINCSDILGRVAGNKFINTKTAGMYIHPGMCSTQSKKIINIKK